MKKREALYHYVLDGHTPVAVDLLTWAAEFEKQHPSWIVDEDPGVFTVFLGVDPMAGCGEGPPLLFETFVNGCGGIRSATWEEALAEHARALAKEWR